MLPKAVAYQWRPLLNRLTGFEKPIMRRLRVDREDDPAPGTRRLKACQQRLPSSKQCCHAGTVTVPGSNTLQKRLAKPLAIRRLHQRRSRPSSSQLHRGLPNIGTRLAHSLSLSNVSTIDIGTFQFKFVACSFSKRPSC